MRRFSFKPVTPKSLLPASEFLNFGNRCYAFLFTLIFVLLPFSAKANENDFKVNTTNAFTVIDKKAVFEKYLGKISKRGYDSRNDQFPGQKVTLEQKGEIGAILVYKGFPQYSDNVVTQLVFSPDHKVAVAYGGLNFYAPVNPHIYLIDDEGTIYEGIDFTGSVIVEVKPVQHGFVLLSNRHGPVNLPGYPLQLSRFDYSGKKVWQKELEGELSGNLSPNMLSASRDGRFIVCACRKRKGRDTEGLTLILDGAGKVLECLKTEYDSVTATDNKTILLYERKHLKVIDLKSKAILAERDLDENDKSFFGKAESRSEDKIVFTSMDYHVTQVEGGTSLPVYNLKEILVFDLNNKKIHNIKISPDDHGDAQYYFSESENKIVRSYTDSNHLPVYESVDLGM